MTFSPGSAQEPARPSRRRRVARPPAARPRATRSTPTPPSRSGPQAVTDGRLDRLRQGHRGDVRRRPSTPSSASSNFDKKGDVTLPGYVVYEWKDGKYDYMHDVVSSLSSPSLGGAETPAATPGFLFAFSAGRGCRFGGPEICPRGAAARARPCPPRRLPDRRRRPACRRARRGRDDHRRRRPDVGQLRRLRRARCTTAPPRRSPTSTPPAASTARRWRCRRWTTSAIPRPPMPSPTSSPARAPSWSSAISASAHRWPPPRSMSPTTSSRSRRAPPGRTTPTSAPAPASIGWPAVTTSRASLPARPSPSASPTRRSP